jgi:hypothetical protein
MIDYVISITSKIVVGKCSNINRSHVEKTSLFAYARLSCDLNKRSTQHQELLLSVFLADHQRSRECCN